MKKIRRPTGTTKIEQEKQEKQEPLVNIIVTLEYNKKIQQKNKGKYC